MKKSRFTETQIVGILNEAEAGMSVKELCRQHGISSPTAISSLAPPPRIRSAPNVRGRTVEAGEIDSMDPKFERAMLRERTQAGVDTARQIRSRRGTPPQALPATAIRDSKDGFGRREDRCRRCTPLQGPSSHRLAAARARDLNGFEPGRSRHIICKQPR